MTLDPAQVRSTVLKIVADILHLPPDDVAHVEDLGLLDGFASFQMVETVERLEDAYAVEFPPGDLEPDVLRRTEGLVRLVVGASGAEAVRS